jgi:outer membrane scaffolding protein for murein synthesis (MipA/OmpV family)
LALVAAETTTEAPQALPLWELGIGAAAYSQPNYPGSDVRSTIAFPFPYVVYRGDRFRIDRSIQGILFETQRLKVDISAGGTSLVESDASDARRGMPDLDPMIEVGPAVSLLLTDPGLPYSVWGKLAARTAYSVDTSNWDFTHQGWVGDARVRYQRPLIGERLRMSVELGTRFADKDYTGYYYDVAAPFATPFRPAYDAGSGYAGSWLGLGLDGREGRWRWGVYGAYQNLNGTAFANSPLVESKNDFSVGVTLGWVFWQSERKVTPKNTSPGGELETPLFGL